MAIGEAGKITTSSPGANDPITVTLSEPLTNPVFAFTGTSNGGDPYNIRLIGQTLDSEGNTTSFTFIIEEWEYLDGPHPATETINWLAIEEGVHTLPDGRIIEAGTTEVFSTARNTGTTETFSAGFTDPPVVLTSIMSNNDTTTVDSDPWNVTASGFNLTLQEEEALDSVHSTETIGWIAFQSGGNGTSGTANNSSNSVTHITSTLDLDATFTSSVVLAETQTLDGPDTATVAIDGQSNSNVGVFIREEQSNDSETNHTTEVVGVVAFEEGPIPCLTKGTRISTPCGDCPIEDLSVGDVVLTAGGAAREIRWIGRRALNATDLARTEGLRPVRISQGALGDDLPTRDLLVSRQHRMLVRSKIAERMFGTPEVLVAAIKLTELPGIFVDPTVETVEYIHLLFDEHEVILAEDTPTESLLTGAEALRCLNAEARAEIEILFPELGQACQKPSPARPIPSGKHQKHLVARHAKNAKPLLN
ncbi:MAG: Hint domain-containing protein [Dinoroseobacter sp.]|nr:Hint domain-containing protein [Dinoroseobacter sp.]